MTRTVSLAEMEEGREGIVRELAGGLAFTRRLEGMGLRLGSKVMKTSGSLLRGPVTVRTGNTQLALGYGMASKVMVETRVEGRGRHDA
jgi:ferrous iron transport protein A